jgi:carboxylesterase
VPPVIDEVYIAGGDRGCLLLHGFTGSPLEMIPLAEALAEDGYTVRVARIAGHGTSPEDLASTTWEDWIASAREALDSMRAECRDVAVLGLSMGGAIALYLAATANPRAVVALATPLRLRPIIARLARAARRYVPYVPVIARVGPRSADVRAYRAAYPRIPLGATGDLAQLLEHTVEMLPRVSVPVMVAQGRRDWAIPPESGEAILERVASEVRRLLWLPHSGHVVTLDVDRADLFTEVRRFLADVFPAAAPGD